jgi:hypothetical protein
MAIMGDFLRNKIVDWLLRAQAYSPPSTIYVGLMTTNATHVVGSGTEVTGGSYARVAITSSMTATGWAGTQSAGSTAASSGAGASAVTSNNGAITFAAPTANWGVVTGFVLMDASTAGNTLLFGPLSVSKTINNGDAAPSFSAGALVLTFDT